MTLLVSRKSFFLFALMISSSLNFQPSFAETLEEAVSIALETHPSIDGALASEGMADQDIKEQRSGYWPDISANITTGRVFSDNSTSRGLSVTRGEAYSYTWENSLTARQMIFDGAETENRLLSAKERKKSASIDLLDIKENLANTAAQAFLDLKRAYTGLEMLHAHESKVSDYLSRIKAAMDEGTSDEAEYQQALDISVMLDDLIAQYQGQVAMAESYYIEVTGGLPETELVKPLPRLDLLPENLEDALNYTRGNHAAILSAQHSSRAAMYDISIENAAFYPDFDGELSYLKSDKKDVIGGETEDAKALLRMSWNFEVGGAQRARVNKKKFQHREALSRIQETERKVERAVRLAYAEYNTARSQLSNQEKRHTLNYKLFETYEVQFEGARIGLLQLMQADNQLFITGLDKMNGRYRVLNAQYSILAAMGRLRESLSLALVDEQQ